jgi:hypothetical protein
MTVLKMTREELHTQEEPGEACKEKPHGRPPGLIAQGRWETTVNSRERRARPARSGGRFRVAAAVSAAALLTTAGAALGAQDPLKGGTTTLANLKLPGKVKVAAKGGATKSGKTVTLPITGGTLDPTNGSGPVQNGGKIQLKKGKNKAKLTSIVTTFGSGGGISAKLNGKKTKLAKISGGTVGRAGFGGTVTDAVAKLTKKGAKALNKALGITHGGFKGGKLGTISTTTVPSTVGVTSATSSTTEDLTGLPACAGAGTCTTYAGKLAEDGITATPSNGANITGPAPPIVVTFTPQTGGSIAPDCTDGTLTGSQGAVTLTRGPASITQANPNDDFGGKVVSFEASAAGVGSLGRATATNLIVTPGTCAADPATKTITVTATQTVNALAATVANQVLGLDGSPCGPGGPPQDCPLAGGDVVGTTTYTITTQ